MLPLFPEGGGGSQHFPNPGCEQAWMIPARVAALAPVLGRRKERAVGARPGGGPAPLPGRPPAQEGQGCFSHLFTTCLTSASK